MEDLARPSAARDVAPNPTDSRSIDATPIDQIATIDLSTTTRRTKNDSAGHLPGNPTVPDPTVPIPKCVTLGHRPVLVDVVVPHVIKKVRAVRRLSSIGLNNRAINHVEQSTTRLAWLICGRTTINSPWNDCNRQPGIAAGPDVTWSSRRLR